MSLFLRDYRLIVGDPNAILVLGGTGVGVVLPAIILRGQGREIKDLQIRFRIVRSSNATQNKAKFEIFNLAPATRTVFETSDDGTNNPVLIFQTRYLYEPTTPPSFGWQTLFTGRVANAMTTKEGPDMITQVEAADGYVPLRDAFTARNFPAGTTRRFVLERLLLDLEVPVGEINDGGVLDQRFESGTTFEGPVRLSLDKLLAPVNVDWSIQDDSFVAVRRDLSSQESVLDLSPETGLINSPHARKARQNRIKDSEDESDHGVVVESLLAPSIRPNRRIRVTSLEYPDGRLLKVDRVVHDGDFRGQDWKSRAECSEFNAVVPVTTPFAAAPAVPFTPIEPVIPPNPVPTLASIDPDTVTEGDGAFTMTLTGTGFIPTSIISWDGEERIPTFISDTELELEVSEDDVAVYDVVSISVINPGPGGGTSNSLEFTIEITPPVEVIVAITSSQDWIVPDGVTVIEAVLLVGAGGPGGSNTGAGGGGGGQVRLETNVSVTPGATMAAVIGTGQINNTPANGGSTTFAGFTAIGGGYATSGSGGGPAVGSGGASGGGGESNISFDVDGGIGVAGFDGGDGGPSGIAFNSSGGGGGGAGGNGSDATFVGGVLSAGNGGPGVDHSATFGTAYGESGWFGGGGGGGASGGSAPGPHLGLGGMGGGGDAGVLDGALDNSGGGGAAQPGAGNSADGIVLIKYIQP